MEKRTEMKLPPLTGRIEDTDVSRSALPSEASDGFAKQPEGVIYQSVSTMSKKQQDLPEGFAEQVASAVAIALEVQLHDMTETLVAAIRAAYHQESAGQVTQLSSQVVAGLAPELAKAVSKACVYTDPAHGRVYVSPRQGARCFTGASRQSSRSSFTSSSKSIKIERDTRAVANSLAEETLRNQGLLASSSAGNSPSETLKTRRKHDIPGSFVSVIPPSESQEPDKSSAVEAASEPKSEGSEVQSVSCNSLQIPGGKSLPGELVRGESKLTEDSQHRKSSVQTARDVLQVRVQELTEEIVYQDDEAVAEAEQQERMCSLSALLKLSGIVGWDSLGHQSASLIYQRSVMLLTFAATMCLIYVGFVTYAHSHIYKNAVEKRDLLLCDIAMACGSFFGFLCLRPWSGSSTLCNTLALLDAYSQRMGLLERWRKRVVREAMGTCVMWLLVIGSVWAGFLLQNWLILNALRSGVGLTVMYTMLICLCSVVQRVCHHLLMFVDAFCCSVSEEPEIDRINHDWNILQAVLRKGASSIEYCFVWIQGSAAVAVPLAVADLAVYGASQKVLGMLLPRCALLLYVFRTLFSAASLTSKCDSVPSVVNALNFGMHTESLRQHIVTYISNSAAGFHVCQVRLTMGMAIKYVYIGGVATFALCTQWLVA